MVIVYLLCLLLFVCLIITALQSRRENFSMSSITDFVPNFLDGTLSMYGKVNSQIQNTVSFWNGVVQEWVPNVGWIYRYRDKTIELERAKHGLPPLQSAMPEVKVSVNANNNRYSTGLSP
jgi:hypothetical protein